MTPKEFIKSTQNDVLLNEYTLQDVIWFMTEFSKQEVREQLTLTDVSHRRELLKSFADWLQGQVWDDKHDDFSDYVEDYIKTL
jgi:hypothetical protein